MSESENRNIMHVLLQAGQQNTNHGISSSIRNNHLIPMVIMRPDLFKITTQINNLWRLLFGLESGHAMYKIITCVSRYTENEWGDISDVTELNYDLMGGNAKQVWLSREARWLLQSISGTNSPLGDKKEKYKWATFQLHCHYLIKYPPMRIECYLTSLCNQVLHK